MNSTSSAQGSSYVVRRALLALGVTLLGSMFGGCATVQKLGDERDLDLFFLSAPMPTLVQEGSEYKTAEQSAQTSRGEIAFHGLGRSMEPLYASGTALVVSEVPYGQLKKGMPVVYINSSGRYVAHMLIGHTSRGWKAIGTNNPMPDAELVTSQNLVGVITQAYASAETPVRQKWMARLAAKETAKGMQVGMTR